jgi:hypothetical protein
MSGCLNSPDKHPTNPNQKPDNSTCTRFLLTTEITNCYSKGNGKEAESCHAAGGQAQVTRSISRRLDRIELAIPLPITRERFVARVRQCIQRTGAGLEAAIATLLRDLSDSELASLGAEVEQVMFGSDIAARDAAKRKVLMDFDPGASV